MKLEVTVAANSGKLWRNWGSVCLQRREWDVAQRALRRDLESKAGVCRSHCPLNSLELDYSPASCVFI